MSSELSPRNDAGAQEMNAEADVDCPGHEDLAEVTSLVLGRLDQQDEAIAAVHDHVRHLEGLVGSLAESVAANQSRLGQCEDFITALGSFSRLLSEEAGRLTSE